MIENEKNPDTNVSTEPIEPMNSPLPNENNDMPESSPLPSPRDPEYNDEYNELTDDAFYPMYLIVPTGYSSLTSVLIVLFVFCIYLALIGYMTSYRLKFVPNYYMLWDFMVGMNNKKYSDEFATYIKTVMAYSTVDLQSNPSSNPTKTDSFVGGREMFTNSMDTNLIGEKIEPPSLGTRMYAFLKSLLEKISIIWNQMMISSFVHGKKVKVSRI
uniref:Uncharacterized protein n=1 Tax=viral metagenome TaxID=1070528 RepID=A0A6C0HTZ5_9ZZZZ